MSISFSELEYLSETELFEYNICVGSGIDPFLIKIWRWKYKINQLNLGHFHITNLSQSISSMLYACQGG